MEPLALLYRIMVLTMARYPASPVDAAFVFGRAHRDYEAEEGDSGILETTAELSRHGLTSFMVIPSQEAKIAYGGNKVETTFPGTEVFRQKLVELGVPQDAVVVPGDYVPHTIAEGDAYIRVAKDRGWKSAVAIMHPHQVLRTMLGFLKSFDLCQHRMAVLPVYPRSVNWQKSVYGSQGAMLLLRHEHIQQEWDRILRYQGTGDLASLGELNYYLTSCLQ